MDELQKNETGSELVKTGEMSLEEKQMLQQIYAGAGLEPVVDAGIKDYDEKLQKENKLLNKVLGTRGSDIKGYGESVAKRVAYAVYQMLNKQYGGKVGDLRAHIMALQDERDKARDKYDDLMGRVVGVLGEEYRELRTDSRVFMEKLTATLGEDLKESKIDQKALAETLADIDGLRQRITSLEMEKAALIEKHESQVKQLNDRYDTDTERLNTRVAELEAEINSLKQENELVTGQLDRQKENYARLKNSIESLQETIISEDISQQLSEEMHEYLMKDSKVPHMVLEGVGKFIDFKKYLKTAAKRGADEAVAQSQASLKSEIAE